MPAMLILRVGVVPVVIVTKEWSPEDSGSGDAARLGGKHVMRHDSAQRPDGQCVADESVESEMVPPRRVDMLRVEINTEGRGGHTCEQE